MAKFMRFACAIALTVACSISMAHAIPLSTDEATCQKTVAKRGRVFLKKRFKALQKCNDDINKGRLAAGTDCTMEAKAAGKIAKAETKLNDKVTDKCTDALVAALDFGGQCLGVSTAASLASCLQQEHASAADDLISMVYPATPTKLCSGGGNDGSVCTADGNCPGGTCALAGSACVDGTNEGGACDDDADCPGGSCLMTKDHAKCAKILGKTVIKHANKRLALIQKCKKSVAKGDLAADEDCVAFSDLKLTNLRSKSIAKVNKKCPDAIAAAQLFGDGCNGADDANSVAACSLCETDGQADAMIAVQHGTGSVGGSASAVQIAAAVDCVDGPNSRCRVGDYLLSNDKIRVVVQDIQRNYLGGIGQFGGQIIDADLVRTVGADRDNFEEWAVSLNVESTAHYTSITVLNDGSNGGPAVIRATGVDDLLDLLNPSSVIADFGILLPPTVDDFDIPVTVHTDYILEPGASFVRVDTTVQNTDVSSLDIFFGEFLNGSGQVELFQSGYGFGEPLIASPCGSPACNRLANMVAYSGELDADGVSYAYVSDVANSSTFTTSGVTVPLLGTDVLGALVGLASANFTLAPNGSPGDALTFSRFFIVGDGTVASLVESRNTAQCAPFGTVSGTVDVGGTPVAGADVVALGDPAVGPGSGVGFLHAALSNNVINHTRTDASGNYTMTLPPGDYDIAVNLDGSPYEGGGSSPMLNPVTVAAFAMVTEDMTIPATGTLRVTVTDESASAIAARISVVGFDPSADPLNSQTVGAGLVTNTTAIFGDRREDGFPFGVAFATYADDSGDTGDIPLEPGMYRVYTSHGTEYSIDFSDVTITAGMTTNVAAVVERVIDSTGFISGDFHVHSIDSPDAAISRVDRVVAMLGEGVDFFATTDHGVRADFSSTVTSLGVGGLITTSIGQEITTFDYGHFNAWPLDFDPLLPNGGFVDHGGAAPDGMDYPSAGFYSETPATIISDAHGDYTAGTNTVQVNHIHSHFGVDGGSGLAIDTGVEPPVSGVPAAARRLDPLVPNFFSGTFDALEVWIGESRDQVFGKFLGQNAGDWFNLINQGIISTGIADSDTHRRFITQSGFPRSMVASLEDDPGLLDQDDVSASVNDGRVAGTNGPMVRVTAHATSTAESGGLDLGRCTGVVACTDTSTCPPCTDTAQCGVGETCTALPTLLSTTDGGVDITVDVQSPLWAPFDSIEFYVNTTTTKSTTTGVETGAGTIDVHRYSLTPDAVHTAGVDFTVSTVPVAGTSSSRLETSTTLSLAGLAVDTWVSVMVVGSDGVSSPLFPVVPNSLDEGSNTTLADLIDGNLGELGMTARAFTNPVFINADGVPGWQAPGVQIAP